MSLICMDEGAEHEHERTDIEIIRVCAKVLIVVNI